MRQRQQSKDKIESAKPDIGAETGSVEPTGTENEEIKEGQPSSQQPLQVYTRRKSIQPPKLIQSSTSDSPQEGNNSSQLDSTSSQEFSDLEIPIAFRKGIRQCTKHPISQYVTFDRISNNHKTFLTALNSVSIPHDMQEALGDKNWRMAMEEEMKALNKNDTWEIVSLPKGKKTVGCKWVFIVKYGVDGTLERDKTRLVAKGYTQTYKVNYHETFAPVAK